MDKELSDRELLELAAKAAGIPLHIWGLKGQENFADMSDESNHKLWDPLTDDGDALRLAVKLHLLLTINWDGDAVAVTGSKSSIEPAGADVFAAMRRAITRCAAEIGKGVA